MRQEYKTAIIFSQIMLILLAILMFWVYFQAVQIISFLANIFMIIGFTSIAIVILLTTVTYETTSVINTNFSEKSDSAMVNKQNEPTLQAKRLHEALNERGIYNELEPFDGHKHVDISIPWAKLNLEIDGKYHLTDPEHLFRDLQRDACSHNEGIDTIRIPNLYVESHLDELADSIREVAIKKRNRI
jgi:very-short-patch-repair endonuclease